MALPAQKQFQYWGLTALVFVFVLWALGDVLLPFILGAAIAYLIDPIADKLEALGLSRMGATAVIAVVTGLIFLVTLLIIIPTLVSQILDLITVLPKALGDLRAFVQDKFPQVFDTQSRVHNALSTLFQTFQTKAGQILETAVGSALSLLNVVVLLVIVPVVAIYLLLDWDRMIARINTLLPLDHAPVIRRLASEIDRVLASFIRGMGTVCLILGIYYAVALMLVGLNFGLAVGFVAGMITFIPYLGSLIGGALAIGLAVFQYWGAIEITDGDTVTYATDWFRIGVVAAIFMLGQVFEGNYLTPKLVGSSVGLHPVWLLLALSVFGTLFGFVGMLVAVPVAAALGVLARFGTESYLESRLYKGRSHEDAD